MKELPLYYSRVQITCYPENFGSRKQGALLGLFWGHRGKSNVEQNAASAAEILGMTSYLHTTVIALQSVIA